MRRLVTGPRVEPITEFVPDSPLEGAGFEPTAPHRAGLFRWKPLDPREGSPLDFTPAGGHRSGAGSQTKMSPAP
jgi:hypothetical protein